MVCCHGLEILDAFRTRDLQFHSALYPVDCATGPVYTCLTELKRTTRGKISQVPPRSAWKVLREGGPGDHYFHTAEVTGILLGSWMLCHIQAGWTVISEAQLNDQEWPFCLLDWTCSFKLVICLTNQWLSFLLHGTAHAEVGVLSLQWHS